MSDYKKHIDAWRASVKNTAWVGVDLDATLAEYTGWHGPDHIGKPIPKMVERVKEILAAGMTVKIFTARMSEPDMDVRRRVIKAIREWTLEHIGVALDPTNVKTYDMIECYDDRIIQVIPNTGVPIEEEVEFLRGRVAELEAIVRGDY